MVQVPRGLSYRAQDAIDVAELIAEFPAQEINPVLLVYTAPCLRKRRGVILWQRATNAYPDCELRHRLRRLEGSGRDGGWIRE